MFLLDTSVLSEARRVKPNQEVQRWLRRQRMVAIPFPVILEIEQGIVDVGRTKPQKATELREWLSDLLNSDFEYPEATPQVAGILAEMNCCSSLKNFWFVNPEGKKDKKPSQDLFIAAISIAHGLPLATMNDSDFLLINQFFPIPGIYNPASASWLVNRAAAPKYDFIATELSTLEIIFDAALKEAEQRSRAVRRLETTAPHVILPLALLEQGNRLQVCP